MKFAVESIPAHLSIVGRGLTEIDGDGEGAGVGGATLDEEPESLETGVVRVVQRLFNEVSVSLNKRDSLLLYLVNLILN